MVSGGRVIADKEPEIKIKVSSFIQNDLKVMLICTLIQVELQVPSERKV